MILIPVIGGLQAAQRMHMQLLQRVLNAPMIFFESTPLGRLVSRFSKDVETIDDDVAICIACCMWYAFEVLF